jgi:hypothetical protein
MARQAARGAEEQLAASCNSRTFGQKALKLTWMGWAGGEVVEVWRA